MDGGRSNALPSDHTLARPSFLSRKHAEPWDHVTQSSPQLVNTCASPPLSRCNVLLEQTPTVSWYWAQN